jgi:hypothetical protein
VAEPHARRGLPERWMLPPAPREEPAASRWRGLPFERRRELAHVGPERLGDLASEDLEVVRGLARARLATSWRLLGAAPLLGWLVLMTVWGFGRASYPEVADRYLLIGLALGAIVWLVAAVQAAGRLRRARLLLADDEDPPTRP